MVGEERGDIALGLVRRGPGNDVSPPENGRLGRVTWGQCPSECSQQLICEGKNLEIITCMDFNRKQTNEGVPQNQRVCMFSNF